MARYVIDAPTLLSVVDQQVQVHPDHQLVAPSSIRSEALGLLLQEVRRGERTETEALELHDRMTALRMRLLGDRVSRRTAWQIARTQDWESLRAAEYLAVARLQADALVTMDPELAGHAADITPLASLQDLSRAEDRGHSAG